MQYGLIGEKLSHSFSKEIHEQLADYCYELCEIPRDKLGDFLRDREFLAINVTIPYKKEVIPFLDEISDEAKALEAVNAIVNRGGKLCGYNTDYLGMRDLILSSHIDISGKKVLVLGSGGTSRTSALVAKDLGAGEVYLVSREKKDGAITYDEAIALHSDAHFIINTTPVGMYPESYACPIDLESFTNLQAVFDAVYNPLKTSLILRAEEMGVHAEGGLYMLVSQAAHAVELFVDCSIEDKKIDEIYRKLLKSKKNIVLVGMPSSGKTTVGKILAEDLSMELFDLDDEIEAHIGCTIAEYFKTHKEKDFRDVETEILKEISKKNHVIIATGGGAILRNENVSALRSNGALFFIDRDLGSLIPTDTRPLASRASDIEKLYKLRYPIYKKVCNFQVDGNLTPREVADLIKERSK